MDGEKKNELHLTLYKDAHPTVILKLLYSRETRNTLGWIGKKLIMLAVSFVGLSFTLFFLFLTVFSDF